MGTKNGFLILILAFIFFSTVNPNETHVDISAGSGVSPASPGAWTTPQARKNLMGCCNFFSIGKGKKSNFETMATEMRAPPLVDNDVYDINGGIVLLGSRYFIRSATGQKPEGQLIASVRKKSMTDRDPVIELVENRNMPVIFYDSNNYEGAAFLSINMSLLITFKNSSSNSFWKLTEDGFVNLGGDRSDTFRIQQYGSNYKFVHMKSSTEDTDIGLCEVSYMGNVKFRLKTKETPFEFQLKKRPKT